MKMPKCGTKTTLFGYFWTRILKTIVMFEISTVELVQLQYFVKKQKCENLRLKMPSLGIFDQKCLIWVFLAKNFKETIVIFESRTLKFTYLRNFTKKQKCLNVGQKMLDLCIFGLEFENSIVTFEISILEFT